MDNKRTTHRGSSEGAINSVERHNRHQEFVEQPPTFSRAQGSTASCTKYASLPYVLADRVSEPYRSVQYSVKSIPSLVELNSPCLLHSLPHRAPAPQLAIHGDLAVNHSRLTTLDSLDGLLQDTVEISRLINPRRKQVSASCSLCYAGVVRHGVEGDVDLLVCCPGALSIRVDE